MTSLHTPSVIRGSLLVLRRSTGVELGNWAGAKITTALLRRDSSFGGRAQMKSADFASYMNALELYRWMIKILTMKMMADLKMQRDC